MPPIDIRPALRGAALALAIPCARAVAQRPDAPRDTTVLPAVNVTGSIVPAAVGPAVGAGASARVTTVGREALRRASPRTLVDALAGQPGLSAYDDLGSPYKLTLVSRGFTAGGVVGLPQGLSVFLDGVPVNEPDAAQVNFDLLPLAHVERVELLAGTASLLGPNSLGGAVNLVTRRGGASPSGEVALSVGSYGRYTGEGSVGGALGAPAGGWRYYAGAGADRDGGWRQASGARSANAFANVDRLGARGGVTLQAFAARVRAETAGSLPASVYAVHPDSNLSAHDFEDLDQLHVAAAGYRPVGVGRGSLRAFVRAHGAERLNVNQAADPDVRSRSYGRTVGASADWRAAGRALGGDAAVRVGVAGSTSATRVRIRADATKLGGRDSLTTDVESPVARGGAFATGDVRYGPLTASAGARLDVVRIPFRNRLDPARDTTSVYRRLNPRVGLALALGRGVSAYASAGRSFRAPAVIELACADPETPCPLPFALGDDPPLAPVVATTVEAGGRWARGRLWLDLSVYRTDVRDDVFMLPRDDAPGGSTIDGYFANLPRTRRSGVEAGARLALPGGHELRASHAYTRATFETEAAIFSVREEAGGENEVEPGDRLPLVPAHTASLGGAFALPARVRLELDARYTGARWLRGDEANETTPLAGHWVTDARVGRDVGRWRVATVVRNALGRRFATFGGFNVNQGGGDRLERFLAPGAPRTVEVSLGRTFGAPE